MRNAILFAVALTAAAATSAQAADRFQINTELTVDGIPVKHMTAYVENGHPIDYPPMESLEVMKVKDHKAHIKNNEKRPIGLDAHITARLSSTGMITLDSKGSYVGFYGYKETISGVLSADFWLRNLSGTKTVEFGEPASFKDSNPAFDGHDAFITVTVTRI